MFAPTPSNPTGSVRSSRRRQRESNDGSLPVPKAKRVRSSLKPDTYTAPESPEMVQTTSQVAVVPRDSTMVGRREMAVRGKKQDRGAKGDGSVLLTTNPFYNVQKLPALPDQLRTNITGMYWCHALKAESNSTRSSTWRNLF